jgi:hypothetical protein
VRLTRAGHHPQIDEILSRSGGFLTFRRSFLDQGTTEFLFCRIAVERVNGKNKKPLLKAAGV